MTDPVQIAIAATDIGAVATAEGRIVVFAAGSGDLAGPAKDLDGMTHGAVARAVASPAFVELKPGGAVELAQPHGLKAATLQIVRLEGGADAAEARRAGGAIGKAMGPAPVLVLAGAIQRAGELALGLGLRAYEFRDCKTGDDKPRGKVTLMVADAEAVRADADLAAARIAGVLMTRDLINLPANVLTTTEFANRLAAMSDLGLEVEVLEEAQLEELGMRTLLAVGRGSETPSKVVVMRWNGGAEGAPPLALIGKGVVFDTGGISIKPAQGMEEMTGDMGGAGVVAGVMRTLALRKAPANVVGIVGLVENMPDGRAARPGDVVTSMKGDTVEIINTDAEGRLVLADVLWYAQERFKPAGMVDLATLTGAVIVALGHEKAGVFSNDDTLCNAFLAAANAEGEGAWRLPLDPAYDKQLKSRIADMKNVGGGRQAGAITAAQFLKRFVKDDVPWVHLDIAGAAQATADGDMAPKGASGWGVLALDRLVRDGFEKG